MSFRKIVLIVLALVVVVPVLLIGFFLLQLAVIYPERNATNKAAAVAWNEAYAETGNALEITVKAGDSSVTFKCWAKAVYAAGGLKDPPIDVSLRVFSNGPDSLVTALSDGVALLTDVRAACREAFRETDAQFGEPAEKPYRAHLVAEAVPLGCNISAWTATTRYDINPPEITRITPLPAKSVIDTAHLHQVDMYAPVNRQHYDGSLSYKNRHTWLDGCWRKTVGGPCQPRAAEICGIPAN